MITLSPKLLSQEAFSTFGDVVDKSSANKEFSMNYGLATRYFDAASIDVNEAHGQTCISFVDSNAIQFPFSPKTMEHHPLGSQLFYPLGDNPFLVMVAPKSQELDNSKIELFITNGKQGVNYFKGVWHHYLMPLNDNSGYIVVDRIADDNNCIEVTINADISITA